MVTSNNEMQSGVDQPSQTVDLSIADERAQTDSFPLDALPSSLRQFTEECAASLPATLEMIAAEG